MANNRLVNAVMGALLGALCAALAPGAASADENLDFYKGKVVRLVNGGSAGSGYDLYSRMLAPYLEKKLGTTVIVESRPGAGMMTAMNHVAIAPPDGLTMMLAPGEGAVLRHRGIPPYAETRQYVPKVLAAYGRLKAQSASPYKLRWPAP